jgi:hypothetical protein
MRSFFECVAMLQSCRVGGTHLSRLGLDGIAQDSEELGMMLCWIYNVLNFRLGGLALATLLSLSAGQWWPRGNGRGGTMRMWAIQQASAVTVNRTLGCIENATDFC